MQDLTHFINGEYVAGTSGRFDDVFNPATGEAQYKCPMASVAETNAAIEDAAAAQVAWGATNPQKRARVMMAMVGLMNRDMDKLAEALSREHGKTIPDAKGDLQRGLEVIEYCIGAPQMLKGEFTDSAGPGIDMYSMRQPLGCGCVDHAVQLSRHDAPVACWPGTGLRQRRSAETVRARPLGPADAGRVVR